jgi:hypothetical protein
VAFSATEKPIKIATIKCNKIPQQMPAWHMLLYCTLSHEVIFQPNVHVHTYIHTHFKFVDGETCRSSRTPWQHRNA